MFFWSPVGSGLRRERALVWWGVALPCLVLMVCLLSPTVTRGGDCGELISASYRLGIAHPSGYPVWCLIGRVFALLPLGEIGWRYNLFSAVAGALATGTLAVAVHRLVWASLAANDSARAPGARAKATSPEAYSATARSATARSATARSATARSATAPSPTALLPTASSATALLPTESSPTTLSLLARMTARWSAWGAGWLLTGFFYVGTQFLIAEVYALAALMGALLLYFGIAWHQDGDWRDACTLALLAGLVPVVHLSGVFFLPWLFGLAVWKRGLQARQLATAGAFFVCGLLPVLYLPIRSAQFPAPPPTTLESSFYWPLDWSHPASAEGLRKHVTAAQYRRLLIETVTETVGDQTVVRRQMAQSPAQVPARLRGLGTFILLGYLWATPLLLIGAWRAFGDPRVGWTLLLIWMSNIAVEINYNVSDQSNFFFPAYLVMALWMGLGLSVFLGALLRRGGLSAAAAPLILLATVGVQWAVFAPPASQRGVLRTRDGALEQARAAQNAATQSGRASTILFHSDDGLWGFWYAQYALGAAPDVATPWGTRVFQTLGRDSAPYVAQLKARGPVFLNQWDEATNARFPLVMVTPSGNLVEATNRKLPPPAREISAPSAPATPGPNGLQSARFRRAQLWKRGEGAPLPNVAIASLAAFEVEFRAPKWASGERVKTRIVDFAAPYAAGQIEVLIAPRGTFGARGPAPTQRATKPDDFSGARLLIAHQKRALIFPGDFRAGALYRASVPLFIDPDSVVGRDQIWTRLVEKDGDNLTPWTATDEVFLTQR